MRRTAKAPWLLGLGIQGGHLSESAHSLVASTNYARRSSASDGPLAGYLHQLLNSQLLLAEWKII